MGSFYLFIINMIIKCSVQTHTHRHVETNGMRRSLTLASSLRSSSSSARISVWLFLIFSSSAASFAFFCSFSTLSRLLALPNIRSNIPLSSSSSQMASLHDTINVTWPPNPRRWRHSVKYAPPARNTEIGTVSLSASEAAGGSVWV